MPFPVSNTHTLALIYFIHSYAWGYPHAISYGYFVIFINNHICHTWIYFLKFQIYLSNDKFYSHNLYQMILTQFGTHFSYSGEEYMWLDHLLKNYSLVPLNNMVLKKGETDTLRKHNPSCFRGSSSIFDAWLEVARLLIWEECCNVEDGKYLILWVQVNSRKMFGKDNVTIGAHFQGYKIITNVSFLGILVV